MVQAWYLDSSDEDQRLEHHLNPPKFVNLNQLEQETGVLVMKVDPDKDLDKLEDIKKTRGYSYTDEIDVRPEKLLNYESMIKSFFKEHIHTDEEIRFVKDGSCYFDVRDPQDNWIRIYVEKGDLIVLPAGIYHRFTLDTKNYVKALRLFAGEPVWTPHYRPAEQIEARENYIKEYPTITL